MRWKESTRNRARYEDPPVGIFAANDNKTRGDHATSREPLNSKFNMLFDRAKWSSLGRKGRVRGMEGCMGGETSFYGEYRAMYAYTEGWRQCANCPNKQ